MKGKILRRCQFREAVNLFVRSLDKEAEEIICAILLSLLIFCLTWMIAARYLFELPAHWAEEITRFAFIWLIYTGAIIAIKRGEHFRITAQFRLLPEKIQKHQLLVADTIWLLYNILLVKYGWDLVRMYSEVTPALQIPMKYAYSIIPLSFVMFSIRLIQFNYKQFRLDKNGEK